MVIESSDGVGVSSSLGTEDGGSPGETPYNYGYQRLSVLLELWSALKQSYGNNWKTKDT